MWTRLYGPFRKASKKTRRLDYCISQIFVHFRPSFSVSIQQFPIEFFPPNTSIVIEVNNPAAPDVQVWRDESPVPSSSKMLQVKDLKITRTYCLSATKSRLRSEPRIWNHVFSDKPGRSEVTYEVVPAPVPSAWRHGFWNKGSAAWSSRPMPLKPSEETGLSRRYLSQKEYMPDPLERKRLLLPDFDEAERKHAKSLARAREMCAQRKLVLQAKRQSQSSSSDSSSSSCTEDEEEAAWKRNVSAHVYNTFERYPLIPKKPKVEKAMGNLKCWMALRVNRGFDNGSYKPYIGVFTGYNPQESLKNTINTIGTLLGVHPIVPWFLEISLLRAWPSQQCFQNDLDWLFVFAKTHPSSRNYCFRELFHFGCRFCLGELQWYQLTSSLEKFLFVGRWWFHLNISINVSKHIP